MDIFSKVAGYFTSIFYLMRFFIDPYLTYRMTKLIIENIYKMAQSPEGSSSKGSFHSNPSKSG